MQFFIHKSVSQIKTENGKKKSSFKIIKGKNGEIHQIKGITSNNDPNILNIHENIQKLNKETGIIRAKHRTFKIKSSDISTLLKNNSNVYKENSTKTVHLKVKKEMSTFKKGMSPVKKESSPVKKEMSLVKKEMSPSKKTVKKEMSPSKKPVKKEISLPKKAIQKEVLPLKKPVKKEIPLVKENASKKDNNNKIEKLNKLIKKKKNYLVGGDVNISSVKQNLNTFINGGVY